ALGHARFQRLERGVVGLQGHLVGEAHERDLRRGLPPTELLGERGGIHHAQRRRGRRYPARYEVPSALVHRDGAGGGATLAERVGYQLERALMLAPLADLEGIRSSACGALGLEGW